MPKGTFGMALILGSRSEADAVIAVTGAVAPVNSAEKIAVDAYG